MNIASRTKMCSTIVIGGFIGYYYRNVDECLRNMVVNLKRQIKDAENPDNIEMLVPPYANRDHPEIYSKHVLDKFPVKHFAFFVTTIYSHVGDPAVVIAALRRLKFVVDTRRLQYNAKNSTEVYMVYGQVNKVLAELDKYDNNGYRKKNKGSKRPKKSKSKCASA